MTISLSLVEARATGDSSADASGSPAVVEMPAEELQRWFVQRGEPSWRAHQLRRHLFQRGTTDYAAMTDLPLALRQQLQQQLPLFATTLVQHRSAPDGTHKLVLRLRDGHLIECVLIQEQDRATACISTQVGCGMGCVFCASGLAGVVRNLTAAEMVEQLLRLRACARRGRLTHIVVMGMGEPLANLQQLLEALRIACDPRQGLGISQRHVTISTVGLPARIRQLADSGHHYHLAVSLHAPNDSLRNRIVPANRKIGIAAILSAADYFFQRTGRQVTYEYVLLGGLNDTAACARELSQLLAGRKAHVNLIPWNDVPGLPYLRPDSRAIERMIRTLRQAGISVKVRKRKGAQIDAACGQLRRQLISTPPSPGSPTVSPALPDFPQPIDPQGDIIPVTPSALRPLSSMPPVAPQSEPSDPLTDAAAATAR
ncbi:MAG: 23S rRNA (adenine(2503)-C(2))-methyltransferase RlmN [Gemmataceae bacterium]|nr:23S rRNA (adenine(2503)-C(2))-methyltransferase RlmN [Gemmataceae bacterium]